MQAQLIANDIACRRGDRLLFRGLTLRCDAGDAVHVTGANGIGKSSLLRILGGLMRPYAGTVSARGAIGLVDERLALDPNLALGRALAFWQRLDGGRAGDRAGDRAADAVYETLQLAPLMDVPVRFLSTGQKKRAALARLLGRTCPIWLLDEPLNGLDTQAQSVFENLVDQHRRAGGIAIIASHQPFALDGAHRTALEDFAA